MTSLPQFDVFLCHNSKDKPEVKQIGEQLIKQSNEPPHRIDGWGGSLRKHPENPVPSGQGCS